MHTAVEINIVVQCDSSIPSGVQTEKVWHLATRPTSTMTDVKGY